MEMNIKELIFSICGDLAEQMCQNAGINRAMSQRLSFEKWLQIELSCRLILKIESTKKMNVVLEDPFPTKKSKRGKSIDIAILEQGKKAFGIELKVIATNYEMEGVNSKTKGLTDKVHELISDFQKMKDAGYDEFMSLAFMFPFPCQLEHRNNMKDFPKQIDRLRKEGETKRLTYCFNNKYKVEFVSLYGSKPVVIAMPSVVNDQAGQIQDSKRTHKTQPKVVQNQDGGIHHVSREAPGHVITSFILGKEYYNKGLIAFSIRDDGYLPRDSNVRVRILVPHSDLIFNGTFTRASNGTRRFINGGQDLAIYFRDNYALRDKLTIKIISKFDYQILNSGGSKP
jgi:hypothetical protein